MPSGEAINKILDSSAILLFAFKKTVDFSKVASFLKLLIVFSNASISSEKRTAFSMTVA